MASLYERIGGKAAVEAAVELFYKKVLADASLQPFFTGVDMQRQKQKQIIFLTYAFGGLEHYKGENLRKAHAHAVEQGLNDSHFDAVAGHLHSTLTELGVDNALIDEVMTIAGGTRDDVLNR